MNIKIQDLKKISLKLQTTALRLPKNIFFLKNLINELILLNLKIENILLDKKLKTHPAVLSKNLLIKPKIKYY